MPDRLHPFTAFLTTLLACAVTPLHATEPAPTSAPAHEPALPPAAPRPNLLVVLVDDMGWADIGYHHPEIRTPRLDSLAATGLRLEQFYVTPQCTPSRVAFLTGRHPSRFGTHATVATDRPALPPATPTLASLLRAAGYATHLSGKWHLGSRPGSGPLDFGFGTAYGFLTGAIGMYDHRSKVDGAWRSTWHRNGERLDETGHATDLIAADAERFIRARATDAQPWLLYAAFNAPHAPLVEGDPRWLTANEHIRDPHRRLFAAAVTHLDDAVGRLVAALDATGQRERTLIVFFSDNGGLRRHGGDRYPPPDPALPEGFSLNTPLRGWKTEPYEGGIRVPAFLNWPGQLAPAVAAAPTHAVDLLPTLLTRAGVALPAELALDGRDQWPVLTAAAPAAPRTLYWLWHVDAKRSRTALRHGDWKIVRPAPEAAWELYDLAADPNETNNIAPAHPDIVARLVALHAAERAKDGPLEASEASRD